MTCKECGFEADGLTFCPICGSRMEGNPQPDSKAAFAESVMAASSSTNAAPTFTPPVSDPNPGAAPTFTPPAPEPMPDLAPSFTPPGQDVDSAPSIKAAPTFVPPGQDAQAAPSVKATPTFTPPASGSAPKVAPTFTPPGQDAQVAPTFTPPGGDAVPIFTPPDAAIGNVETCCDHTRRPAVANCSRCGRPMCQDCVDALGVGAGEFAGKPLCATCTYELIEENNRLLVEQYKYIKYGYINMAIGAIVGVFLMSFVSPWIALLTGAYNAFGPTAIFVINILGACAGMGFRLVFRDTAKLFFGMRERDTYEYESMLGRICALLFSAILSFLLCLFIAPIRAAQTLIRYLRYQRETRNFIEEGNAALDSIEQYMTLTTVLDQNPNIDIRELTREGGVLENNPYAQTYIEHGQQAVENHVREQATIIAQNGEVIRGFELSENGEIIRPAT